MYVSYGDRRIVRQEGDWKKSKAGKEKNWRLGLLAKGV